MTDYLAERLRSKLQHYRFLLGLFVSGRRMP